MKTHMCSDCRSPRGACRSWCPARRRGEGERLVAQERSVVEAERKRQGTAVKLCCGVCDRAVGDTAASFAPFRCLPGSDEAMAVGLPPRLVCARCDRSVL